VKRLIIILALLSPAGASAQFNGYNGYGINGSLPLPLPPPDDNYNNNDMSMSITIPDNMPCVQFSDGTWGCPQ
jgi:hypothetical protein